MFSQLTQLLVVTLLAGAALGSGNKYGNCMSKTDAVYVLPDTPLASLNEWLKNDHDYKALVAEGCKEDRDDGSVCFNKPAIGSGLAQVSSNYFLGLTDRGPNQDCEDLFALDPVKYAAAEGKSGKGFPVKNFAPTIVHFTTKSGSKTLGAKKFVPLRGSDGKPISGISNTMADDTPYGRDCVGEPLPYDPSGLDTEDIAIIPGTSYAVIVDEYSPSVALVHYETGVIAARHVPASVKMSLEGTSYPIIGDVPDVYTNRRKNRGFEGVVVDKKGKYAIAIVQSPMLGPDEEKTESNAIIRCAFFKMSVESGKPSLSYEKSFIIEASNPGAYDNPDNKPKDMKYSGGFHIRDGVFMALERAKGQVKLFTVDFRNATNIDETKYADNLGLEEDTNGIYTAKQFGVKAAKKVLVWESVKGVGGSVDFTGGSKQEGFVLDVNDNTKVWMIDDNDFGLEGNGKVELREMSLGRAVKGATVCELPEHPPRPDIDVVPNHEIKLTNSQTYRISDEVGAGAAENFDVNEELERAYVANDDTGFIDMYDLSVSPAAPMKSYNAGVPYKPTSTSVCEELELVAVGLADYEDDGGAGRVDILDNNLNVVRRIRKETCILPDHVKWSDDCKFLVAACEGEGADIRGGVMVVDFGGPAGDKFRGVKVASFKKYDKISHILEMNGIRLIESKTPSLDLEPEYVSISGKNAFVTLQGANAISVVDLYEARVTELKPIGFIDRSKPGFALDASNEDGGINIKNYPKLYGMPQPDTIVTYMAADGEVYLVIANEGDSKDDAEEARGGDITDPEELGRNVAPELKMLVEDEAALGRLKFSTIMGYNVTTNTQEKMFHFGSRSFSIMALNGTIVFDSGEWFARIQEKHFPEIFNANGFDDEDLSASQADQFDDRSDDKGMEPESLSIMTKDGKSFAFIGFERPSIIVVFDITHPTNPQFVDAVQNHPINDPINQVFAEGRQGDLDPEALFASAKLNKLFVSGSVSNTISSYDIEE